jgi:hypothetical protein
MPLGCVLRPLQKYRDRSKKTPVVSPYRTSFAIGRNKRGADLKAIPQ